MCSVLVLLHTTLFGENLTLEVDNQQKMNQKLDKLTQLIQEGQPLVLEDTGNESKKVQSSGNIVTGGSVNVCH